jgi:membrane protein implicated in regulation of membrane protease activity
MIAFYLGALIAGLLLGVAVMLFGIERRKTSVVEQSEKPIRPSLPLVAAFAIAFGVAGYLFSRFGSSAGALIAAVAIGSACAIGTRWVVKKSATISLEHDVEDERFVLQGHVARVVSSIGPGGEGRIIFDLGDERKTLRARSLDEGLVEEGTEVVIERIEGDLAYVEPWLQVEERL